MGFHNYHYGYVNTGPAVVGLPVTDGGSKLVPVEVVTTTYADPVHTVPSEFRGTHAVNWVPARLGGAITSALGATLCG